MLKIGVTGGIGSGKTVVCKIFEALGAPVYYADIEAKKILSSDSSVKRKVKELLGKESYYVNGKANRKFIASKVFDNKSLLKQLNEIVHPAVAVHSARWFESIKGQFAYAVKEAALLIESGSYKELNLLIVVTAPEALKIQRVTVRDQISEEQVRVRMKNQLPDDQKVELADFIILNDDQHSLVSQVWKIHQQLLKKRI
jgi:dephospho-CoA kinase